jgi:hypothetical protein
MSVACVALVLLSGCGGGGDSKEQDAKSADTATATATETATETATATEDSSGSGGGGDTMSAAAWSQRVEAICAKTEKQAFKAGKKLGQKSAQAGDSRKELTYKILKLEAKLLPPWMDKIESLPKPEGKEQAAEKFSSTMRNVGDLLDQTAEAIEQNDETNGKKLVKKLAAATIAARSQARQLNISKCNPSPSGGTGA